jgi:hypothetical protein
MINESFIVLNRFLSSSYGNQSCHALRSLPSSAVSYAISFAQSETCCLSIREPGFRRRLPLRSGFGLFASQDCASLIFIVGIISCIFGISTASQFAISTVFPAVRFLCG